MNNSGWVCPKCSAVFAPFMMECKYCNKKESEETLKDILKKSIPLCLHEWDMSLLLSNPPQRRCIKCNIYEIVGTTRFT